MRSDLHLHVSPSWKLHLSHQLHLSRRLLHSSLNRQLRLSSQRLRLSRQLLRRSQNQRPSPD